MIREYTEVKYYAIVKIQAPEGTSLQTLRDLSFKLYAESGLEGDIFIEGLTVSFEGSHSCDRLDAVRDNGLLAQHLSDNLPEGWKVVK